ncbi:unnamed protein product [Macrosiphum euphorbiae]|uniref:Uncharacterized protein n=1 Tax=Macrosiphum euphorbiae TaxID=13131 RepID=A0AAV0VI66_9HEMI|nr:unnamed protein product [Macrosiphum euphorbiae]
MSMLQNTLPNNNSWLIKILKTFEKMDVEDVLSDVVSMEDLEKFEKEYHNQLTTGTVSQETKFHYAWCLEIQELKNIVLRCNLLKHLTMQPGNMQAQNLLVTIQKKMESDVHKGMAVAGALALGLSAIVGIGFALSKGLKK